MSKAIFEFLERSDPVLHDGRLALVCNHTSFVFQTGRYLFQELASRGNLVRVFVPEHGLFAELQDQVGLDRAGVYSDLAPGVEFVSLYGSQEKSLVPDAALFKNIDAVIVDMQDVGSRYYTFLTTAAYMLEALHKASAPAHVFVIDRSNPAGRQVEGTPLKPEYESFVGRAGLLHRHGLTFGERLAMVHAEGGMKFPLTVQKAPRAAAAPAMPGSATGWEQESWAIPPSPNMPGPLTPLVYSGQCLLEGTNLSEGRGTTRPFEIFGAPFLRSQGVPTVPGALLRNLRFLPTFHKHAGVVCNGFQIHVTGTYHSLGHSLKLLRWARESFPEFAWRKGAYEFRSDRPAIELLAGDPTILAYLNGTVDWTVLREAMDAAEREWVQKTKPFLLYDEPLSLAGNA